MAKGDVTIKFAGEDSNASTALNAFRKGIEETADKSRKMGADVSKAGDAMSKMGKSGENSQGLANTVSALGAITKAAELATAAMAAYTEQEKKRAEVFAGPKGDLKTALANVGRTADFTEANKAINTIQSSAFDVKGKTGIMVDAITRTKGEFDQKQVNDAILGAVRYGETGASNTGAFAATRLQLGKAASQAGSGWEKMSEKDMSELTAGVLARNPEGFSPQDLKLLYEAKNKDTAVAEISALRASGETDKGGAKLVELASHMPTAEEAKKWRGPARGMTEEERSRKAIYESGKTAEDRLAAIFKNPKIVPQSDRALAENVGREFDPNWRANTVASEPLKSAFNAKQDMMEKDKDFKALEDANRAKIDSNKIEEKGGRKAKETETEVERSMNTFKTQITDNPLVTVPLQKGAELAAYTGFDKALEKLAKTLEAVVSGLKMGAEAQHATARAVNGGAALKAPGKDH